MSLTWLASGFNPLGRLESLSSQGGSSSITNSVPVVASRIDSKDPPHFQITYHSKQLKQRRVTEEGVLHLLLTDSVFVYTLVHDMESKLPPEDQSYL